MATTVAYAASLCTRKTGSSSNAKNNLACQEFYENSYNYVGIICFSGMNLANKVITDIWLTIDAAKAGYGAGSSKTARPKRSFCGRRITRTISNPGLPDTVMPGMNWEPLTAPSTGIPPAITLRAVCSTRWRLTSRREITPSPSTIRILPPRARDIMRRQFRSRPHRLHL